MIFAATDSQFEGSALGQARVRMGEGTATRTCACRTRDAVKLGWPARTACRRVRVPVKRCACAHPVVLKRSDCARLPTSHFLASWPQPPPQFSLHASKATDVWCDDIGERSHPMRPSRLRSKSTRPCDRPGGHADVSPSFCRRPRSGDRYAAKPCGPYRCGPEYVAGPTSDKRSSHK
jgi:hypothetical protein